MLSVLFARPSASAASYGRTEDGASPCASNPKEMRRPAASQPKEMRRPATSLTGRVVRIADGDTLTILSPNRGARPQSGLHFYRDLAMFCEDICRASVYGRLTLLAHAHRRNGRISCSRHSCLRWFSIGHEHYAKSPSRPQPVRKNRSGFTKRRARQQPFNTRGQKAKGGSEKRDPPLFRQLRESCLGRP